MNTSPTQPTVQNRWKSTLSVAGYLLLFLLGFLFRPVYEFISSISSGRHLQTIETRDQRHVAKLYKKYNLGDMNFIVTVDGREVYRSSDNNTFYPGQYRETLLWDTTGTVVVLELMGKRVFAYNAETKQKLGKGELRQYKLYPLLSDIQFSPIADIDE